MDVSNGEGVGISLFVQGCHFHCRGCFNSETWDFNGGKEWTDEIEEKFFELAKKPYIKRISILGGEPLADENVCKISQIIWKLKTKYPDKKIWLYTGYEYESIISQFYSTEYNHISTARLCSICGADIVVDGKFQIENQDLYNEKIIWAGSTNQRIINSHASIKDHKIVLYNAEN